MAKVTWLGEDELHGGSVGGPSFMVWNGLKFPKGQAVEVTNPTAIAKAKGNRFFKVEGGGELPKAQPAPHEDEPQHEPPLTHHERAATHPRQRTRHVHKDDE